MREKTAQLTLGFLLREELSFANFLAKRNQEVVYNIHQCVEKKANQFIYLWGRHGVGKTHLLNAACSLLPQNTAPAAYISLSTHQELSVECLDGLEGLDLVCVDDIDAVANNGTWEQALFHLYNRIKQSATSLIITGSSVPDDLGLCLKDLVSRLKWGLVLHINELHDPDKLRALQDRAVGRGFELPDSVGAYLLSHYARDTHALFALLDKLDQESLVAQRKLTIPFVKGLL